MIFRLSQKLAKKLKITALENLPPSGDPFADWSANLFTVDRAQYVILTNTQSLYSVVLQGRGITDQDRFFDRACDSMREHLIADGREFAYSNFIAPTSGSIRFASALNRSVTGSMNDLVHNAKWSIGHHAMAPLKAGIELNKMPMSALGYRNPRDVFTTLCAQRRAAFET
jgi:uncharacterized protein DUF6933